MRQVLAAVIAHSLLCIAFVAVFVGVAFLEGQGGSASMGYGLLFSGAAVLVFLPQRLSLATTLRAEWRMAAILSAAASVGLALGNELPYVLLEAHPGPWPLVPLWGGAVALLLFAAFSVDRDRSVEFGVPPRAVLPSILVFLVALAARAFGPDTLVGDEIIHSHVVIGIAGHENPWVLGAMGADGYPYIFLYLQLLVTRFFAPIADVITVQKWLSFVCGALSVMFLYIVVRIRSGAVTALCAAILLSFFGWHWVNSRFIYAYPPDLAVISFGILAVTVAFRRRSFGWSAAAGLSVAASLMLQKGGMLLGPVLGYLFLEEFLLCKGRQRWMVVSLALVSLVAFLIGYEPYLIQQLQGTYTPPLQAMAVRERAETLPKLGLTPYSALGLMFWDAARQLQVSMSDFGRHMFRPRAPILDPLFSALFSVGLVHCVAQFRRSQTARLCILGLLVFVLPMALSFPVNDLDRGIARRMLGISFFLAWIGALGAEQIARRVCSSRLVPVLAGAFCGVSALTNIWLFFAVYQKVPGPEWYSPVGRGLQSKAMINLVLRAEASRIPTVVMEGYDASVLGVPDSREREASTLSRGSTVAEVRSLLLARPGILQLVVIPWDTRTIQRESTKTVDELADIVPPYLWIAGPPDQDGIPMVRYAYVRVDRKAVEASPSPASGS